MANLKADLLNDLRNQKYYAEMELLRLAQEPNMNYREKIYSLDTVLGQISNINNRIGLAEVYFQEAPVAQQFNPNVPQAPKEEPVQAPVMPQVHQGQTHGE